MGYAYRIAKAAPTSDTFASLSNLPQTQDLLRAMKFPFIAFISAFYGCCCFKAADAALNPGDIAIIGRPQR